jgi:hypothetical protein
MPAGPVLLLACGALARELHLLRRQAGCEHVEIDCLPAELHNTPDAIPGAIRARLEAARGRYGAVFVAYADCGTGGRLDALLDEYGVERLPGAHCYALFTGEERFAALHEAEPGSFYLTDFLVRHFERLVIRGLGLDRHPELLPDYFGNYRRVVYLAQTRSPELERRARACAERLGLACEVLPTGLGPFARALAGSSAWPAREGAAWPG